MFVYVIRYVNKRFILLFVYFKGNHTEVDDLRQPRCIRSVSRYLSSVVDQRGSAAEVISDLPHPSGANQGCIRRRTTIDQRSFDQRSSETFKIRHVVHIKHIAGRRELLVSS